MDKTIIRIINIKQQYQERTSKNRIRTPYHEDKKLGASTLTPRG